MVTIIEEYINSIKNEYTEKYMHNTWLMTELVSEIVQHYKKYSSRL